VTSVASILNDVGIPWPDADSGKAREAARAWSALAQAASEAMSLGGSAAATLTARNTGAAMDAFSNYWASVGGPYEACVGGSQTAMLPVLADACNALSAACEQFADAVDQVKSKLEETAAEIAAALAAGAAATFFTLGISDAVADGVTAALVAAGFDAIGTFGATVASIISAGLVGGAFGALDTMIDSVLTDGIKAKFGDQLPSDAQTIQGLAEGVVVNGLAEGVAGTTGLAAKAAALNALVSVPDDVSKLVPDLTAVLAGIPDALETPAGQALNNLASQYAVNSGVAAAQGNTASPPSVPDILGEVLDAKIEAAGEGEEKSKK